MKLLLPSAFLRDAASFLEERGADGCEGTAMIAALPDGIGRLVVPDQVAGRSPYSQVEVTDRGKLELACALRAGEVYLARIHSHPGDEPHSLTDDRNPVLTYQGALSIVVPFFGLAVRRGLQACRVYRLLGRRWIELTDPAERDQHVTDEG